MTAGLVRICNQCTQTLVSRDAGGHLSPILSMITWGVDKCFNTNFYCAVRGIVSDMNALSITYTVDAVNSGRRGYRDGDFNSWIAAVFFGASVTEASGIACQLGYCLSKTQSAVIQLINTTGDIIGFWWKGGRVKEIHESDYVKGAEDAPGECIGQKTLAESRRHIDLVRYAIWTVSALSAAVFSYLSAIHNPFAKIAESIAQEYAVSLIVNGVRGALGLIGFIIGLNLVGRVRVHNESGAYQDMDAAKDVFGGPQEVRNAAKRDDYLMSGWEKVQYIVDSHKRTSSASKIVRLVLAGVENLSRVAGYTDAASGMASFSDWLKNKQRFCKLAVIPSWISKCVKNCQSHLDFNAASAKAWLEWGFVGMYDVCAVPAYLYDKAGGQLATNTKWFLREATRHWCSLFQAAALVVEFGCNVESKPHKNTEGIGARDRFVNGLSHLGDGTALSDANWRDTIYLVDRVSAIVMTSLTLYRWVCDVRGEKFANFGTLMLVFDAAKAGAGLAKNLWEDQDDSGFIEQQAETYLKTHGVSRKAA